MRVRFHEEAAAFLAAADPFFESDPFSTSVIAVVASRVIAEGDQPGEHDRLWVTVEDTDGTVLGVAMHTPPWALFVSRMPPDAAAAIAGALVDAHRDLPGVNGACDSTAAFAEAWSARTGQISTIRRATRMYWLEKLNRPRQVSGGATLAAAPDVELLADWFTAFHDESQGQAPSEDWVRFAERRVAAGQIHLWRDAGAPVSVAGVSAPATGVARVGPVYTPVSARRKGYGTAVTSAAAAAAIAGGAEHVVLYTDLANPTSNSIYQAIGFRPDHDAEERAFR